MGSSRLELYNSRPGAVKSAGHMNAYFFFQNQPAYGGLVG